jgi:uncharacterized protein YndB with AHSA1/START domain
MRDFGMMALAAGLLAIASDAKAADGVNDTSFQEPNGDRVLQQSIDIAAPPACIWRSLADEDGLKAFGMTVAHVEMKNGGLIEEGFSPTAKLGGGETIRHRIIAYLPERLLVLRNEATPPGLPHAELYRNVVQVISIEPREGGGTRFTISHTGYGAGADYDQLYAFFQKGNPNYLTGVKTLCEAKSAPSSRP